MLSRLIYRGNAKIPPRINNTQKRTSGHNAMNIKPSAIFVTKAKDIIHFYTLLGLIPITVITVITNMSGTPELAEIPEGYEPRHWEYYKRPLTRWIAKWFYYPAELEFEVCLARCERRSENSLAERSQREIESVMRYYNDHRSHFFVPFYGNAARRSRDNFAYLTSLNYSDDSRVLENQKAMQK